MVPYLLTFNTSRKRVDHLGVVDTKTSRNRKRAYVRARPASTGEDWYSVDLEPGSDESDWEGAAVAAIIQRELDWGDLADEGEMLEAAVKLNGVPQGVVYKPSEPRVDVNGKPFMMMAFFSIDPGSVTLESANRLLGYIGGALRLGE